ncbi:MAG: glycosyltransferase [Acidobacteria bacterium]|nr:glycosyltransferase [Acidobacteriota bacterium]
MSDLSQVNIAFLAGTLGQGGSERQLFYLLRALKQNGARSRLYCLTRGEFWEETIRDLGIPVIWIGQHPSRFLRLARLINEIRTDRPAIIQSQHIYTNIYVVAAARALGLREIGALRNDIIMSPRSVGRIMGKLSLHLPRIVAVNSQAAISKATRMGMPASQIRLLRNVVDTDHFTPAPRAEDGTKMIAAIGRLVRQKRFDRMLSIIARVRVQSRYPVRAMIVGDGPLRSQLEEQAAELGLSDAIEFKGTVTDIRVIYRAADALLLTSDWEGSPNVVLEAMACGLPVVATGVGDVPEIILEGETGFLARPEDDEKLVAGLLELLHNPPLKIELGRRAREHVVAEHSPQQLPHRLQNFYEAVLA